MTEWAWIPIVLGAVVAQTVRNAAQRSLIDSAGVLPATFVRFFYGLPFAVVALAVATSLQGMPIPVPTRTFALWLTLGAVAQLVATAFFVGAMAHRSFVVAVVYSKTEIVQVAIFSVVLLGESLAQSVRLAIGIATAGVLFLSVPSAAKGRLGTAAWFSRGALLGLASGASFAIASVAYRAAMLDLGHSDPWVAGMYSVVWAQTLQAGLLLGWLVARDRPGLAQTFAQWRPSLLAGAMGTAASIGWFTAYALRSAVDVRILALAEVVLGYVLSRRLFGEEVGRSEIAGIVLVVAGIVVATLAR